VGDTSVGLLQRVADTLRGMRLDRRIPPDARDTLSRLSDDLQALLDSAPEEEEATDGSH
jgi:hypothetical protein